jgi:hypothetical protein
MANGLPTIIHFAHYLRRHIYMVISEVATLLFYVISIAFLPEYFGAFSVLEEAFNPLIGSCRPLIRRHCQIPMETSCHRGGQCSSTVYREDDSAQGCTSSLEQIVVTYIHTFFGSL